MDTNDFEQFDQQPSFRADEQTPAWFPLGN